MLLSTLSPYYSSVCHFFTAASQAERLQVQFLNVTQSGINHHTYQYQKWFESYRVNIDGETEGVHSWPDQERLWWLVPTVIFWWYAIFILYRMEGHNLHYAHKSIIHEPNSSQNSKTQLFDLRITTVHPFLLSSSSPLSGLLSYTECSTCRGAPALAVPWRSWTWMPPSSGKYRHTQEMWISDD